MELLDSNGLYRGNRVAYVWKDSLRGGVKTISAAPNQQLAIVKAELGQLTRSRVRACTGAVDAAPARPPPF